MIPSEGWYIKKGKYKKVTHKETKVIPQEVLTQGKGYEWTC